MGSRYLLTCTEDDGTPHVELSASRLMLTVHPGSDETTKREALAAWYREQVRLNATQFIHKYEAALGVSLRRL